MTTDPNQPASTVVDMDGIQIPVSAIYNLALEAADKSR